MTETKSAHAANDSLEPVAKQTATGTYIDTILNRSKMIWARDRQDIAA